MMNVMTQPRLSRQLWQVAGCAVLLLASAPVMRAQGAPAPSPTGIEGVVVDSAGRPLANARLVVRDTARVGTQALRRSEATSDSTGVFRIIGLPAGAHVLEVTRDEYEPAGFQFNIGTGITAKVRITLQADPLWAEMKRAADSILAADRADSIAKAQVARAAPPGVAFGSGVLSGRVLTPEGTPVGRAQVQAMGTNYNTMTDSSGRFRLGELPVGPYFLRARKVGFDPVVFSAQVVRGDSLDASITLTPFTAARGTRLDTVRVTADAARSSRRLAGFQQRKATARGLYIDRNEIQLRRPTNFSDLLRGRANITVQRNSATGETQVFGPRLSISGGYCQLALIIDGTLIPNAASSLDTLVPPDMVLGIEVYNSGTSVPGEFQRLGTDCGAIIVWTR
ncbi:MAG: carboxypeptidase-like regulatory domain-containing protein [Gemmatimonadota bacterium]